MRRVNHSPFRSVIDCFRLPSIEHLFQTLADAKPGPKKKVNEKEGGPAPRGSNANENLVQSKLVLLTLSFPRLRIIWSSSPYASAEIVRELKANFAEPDVAKAISLGVEEGSAGGTELEDVNTLAEDLLRALPGIGTKQVRYVMNRVESVAELCRMSLEDMQQLLGAEPGKKCYDFIRSGASNRTRPRPA